MTALFANQEVWHVLLASDDMKRMNVDQLDDAFRLSLVDASTMVWKAGMNTWQRLGSIAGIDDELETIARPVPAARQLTAARAWPAPPSAPPPRRPAPPALAETALNPFAATTPVFSSPQLLAPVYSTPLAADPYVLPKRRVAIPSEVDFRRSSRGVRWGRWLGALVLLTGAVLVAHRQDLLRQGARQLGLENKYLAGERRVTAFVATKSPPQLRAALTRLALLPSTNALVPSELSRANKPLPAPAALVALTKATPEPSQPSQPEVKTVSLDSLPLLTSEPAVAAASPAPIHAARPHAPAAREPKPRAKTPARQTTAAAEAAPEPAPAPKRAQSEPALPPASPNESFLKAAIRQAIVADTAKGK
ncbi:MAG TPA: hypothetical protein VIW29_09725 [Polyangiaceae bacterium]